MLNTIYWTEDRDDEFCRTIAARVPLAWGDVIAFGHTPKPWRRAVDGMHFINTGSVGRPKDDDWRTGYVRREPGSGDARIEFVRVEHDADAAAHDMVGAGLPDELAEFLRSGGRATAGSR